jgi:hypothetical protein
MRKLAVFVEGLTEQLFADKLLNEIIGRHSLVIEHRQVVANGKWIRINASRPHAGQKYFVLIVDCSADNRVKSQIRDRYDSLVSAGYDAIIGIRDVYPEFALADTARLRSGLEYGMKTKPIRVLFVLGIMEIESWFISEYSHFGRLDARLTPELIACTLGFDPSRDDIQQRPHPATDLDNAYRLAGLRYIKKRPCLHRTAAALDYAALYCEVTKRIPDLRRLVDAVDAFASG